MAEKACHVFGSTTQVGLTQALCAQVVLCCGVVASAVAAGIRLASLASGRFGLLAFAPL
jgi:hypothetical protein